MKYGFLFIFSFLFFFIHPAKAEVLFSSSAQEQALKNETKQSFNKTDFYFAFGSSDINEYIPKGSTLQNWEQMLAVYIFPNFPTVEEYAAAFMHLSKQKNIKAKAFKTEKDGGILIAFPMASKEFMEMNFWRYVPNPAGKGIIGYQYAKRYYGITFSEEEFVTMYQSVFKTFPDMPLFPFIP